MSYAAIIAKEFNVKEEYVANIIALLDEGNTIPFIARYRKEMHGTMDDQTIRQISDKLEYLRNLDARRQEVRSLIEGQGNLTPEIEEALKKAVTLAEIDDIYRPFRPKRKTRASIAKEKGIEPLAQALLDNQQSGADPDGLAAEFVDPEKGVEDTQSALQGACDIIAEMVSDNAEVRKR
ncbi:MAG: RNA-binding transcriptional accessory protein, partial [Clostridia bacterium]|nr:RNA-binding transcriptional accessory protein [Clostridia bacterium]